MKRGEKYLCLLCRCISGSKLSDGCNRTDGGKTFSAEKREEGTAVSCRGIWFPAWTFSASGIERVSAVLYFYSFFLKYCNGSARVWENGKAGVLEDVVGDIHSRFAVRWCNRMDGRNGNLVAFWGSYDNGYHLFSVRRTQELWKSSL